jgi:hypothetical protein
MDANDAFRFDYEQTTELMRTLTDIRFKLLAFVPTIAGAAVGFMGSGQSAAELLAVGLLGLAATFGVLLYELRNSELYDSIIERAVDLEEKLGLGLLTQRAQKRATLFGLVSARHERGVGLVYGAALAGWTYLFVWGVLRALDVGGARNIGAVVGVLVGAAVVVEVERLARTPASHVR